MKRERKRKKETYINLILTSLFQNHRVHSNQRSSLYSPIPKNQRKTANPLHLTAVPSFNILYFQCICSESLNCIPRLILINNLFVPRRVDSLCPFGDSFPLENTCQVHLTLIILLCHTPGRDGFTVATAVV